MKILEVIQSLASGGAERLVVDLCNELSKTEEVSVLILKDVEHFYLPQLSPKVKVIQARMPVGGSIRQLIQCCQLVRKIAHPHSARLEMVPAKMKKQLLKSVQSVVYFRFSRKKASILS